MTTPHRPSDRELQAAQVARCYLLMHGTPAPEGYVDEFLAKMDRLAREEYLHYPGDN